MASASSNKSVSREEYLKRYLSSEDSRKKTKKKKKAQRVAPVKKPVGLKIIDTDIDVRIDNDDIEDEVGEEAPTVAAIIDERPVEEQFKTRKKYSQWEVDDFSHRESQQLESLRNPVRERNDSDSSISPRRSGTGSAGDTEFINKIRRRHDSSDSDESQEPRTSDPLFTDLRSAPSTSDKTPRHSESVVTRQDSDNDLSPPRVREESSKPKAIDSDGDFSPPRQRNATRSLIDDGDLSPRKMHSSSTSVSVKGSRADSDSDLSPERIGSKSKGSSTDLKKSSEEKSRPETTLSGLKAGLQSASLLREESKRFKERQMKHIQQMSDEISGRNSEVVYRDRATGAKRDLAAEKKKTEEEQKKKDEREKKYAEWGKGMEQRAEQTKRFQEDIYEMSKPLARYEGDSDLDRILKEQDRLGDPMLEYILKKKKKNQSEAGYPEYKGPAPPPNRFSIKPGYRWDGVDRSNGFEKRYFEKKNSTISKETEAHLWSVQDM